VTRAVSIAVSRAEVGVAELERVAARGWQGTSTDVLGDWLLRAGAGFTGRANSVLPLGSPSRGLPAALSYVEAFYRDHGLPALFQVPECGETAELQGFLDEAGWTVFNQSSVLTAGCAVAAENCPPVAGWPPASFADRASEQWLGGYLYRGQPLPPSAVSVLENADAVVFGSLEDAAGPAAVVRGVLTDGWLGVTALTVDESRRRSGAGGHLMGELLRWAVSRGADDCYLQVAAENGAALGLYGRLGFTEHHRYHYRRSPVGHPAA
jgi:ribosomal protein S18 acetylase RimI-like enzyme